MVPVSWPPCPGSITIFPIFNPRARIRERSPLAVGFASRMPRPETLPGFSEASVREVALCGKSPGVFRAGTFESAESGAPSKLAAAGFFAAAFRAGEAPLFSCEFRFVTSDNGVSSSSASTTFFTTDVDRFLLPSLAVDAEAFPSWLTSTATGVTPVWVTAADFSSDEPRSVSASEIVFGGAMPFASVEVGSPSSFSLGCFIRPFLP